MLDARVFALGVLTNNNQIHAGVARRYAWQIADGTKVTEQLEFLAQRHIDAGKPLADRRGHRTFEANTVALDGSQKFLGKIFLILRVSFGAGGMAFPLEFSACGLKNAHNCVGYFWADSVAGNEGDGMHDFVSLTPLLPAWLWLERAQARFPWSSAGL